MNTNKNKDEIRHKLETEPDFVCSKQDNYSLKSYMERNPDGAKDNQIGLLLMMSMDQIEKLYAKIIEKGRQRFKLML
jgi:hypothetical protein